ncbi:MAG: hypothetical protein EU539_12530, partial [Promethearchaeota archaeon]
MSLLFGFILMLILTGLFFLYKAFQNRLKNMAILGIGTIAFPIGFIGNFVLNLGSIFQEYFVFIGLISVVIFTNMTFYKGQMKKANIILIIVIILGIIQIIMFHLYYPIEVKRNIYYYLRVSLDLPYVFLVFNWLAYSCYLAFERLKEQDIEPWIKARYKLLAISSFILSLHSIPEFFQPKNIRWGNPSDHISLAIFGITAVMAIVYAIIFSISWFMPKPIKNYFNKDYKTDIEKEYTEEELMEL